MEATESHQKTNKMQSQMQSQLGFADPCFPSTEQLRQSKNNPFEAQRSCAILHLPG
jgi:hypothetical protein